MLAIEGITKRFDPPSWLLRLAVRTAVDEPVVAVRDVSFGVARGEVVGLIGPNGAGKTTLIKVIATLLEPTGGRVVVDGHDAAGQPGRVRERLGLVLADDRGLYGRLSGRENLEFFGVLSGLSRPAARTRADELLQQVGIAHRDKLVFGYSSGMRTRLSLARALVSEPALLVLDEPTRSLDPLVSKQVAGMIRDLAADGRAVLLSSHRLDEVAAICDRVVLLHDGTVRFDGRPAALHGDAGPAAALLALLEAEAGSGAGASAGHPPAGDVADVER